MTLRLKILTAAMMATIAWLLATHAALVRDLSASLNPAETQLLICGSVLVVASIAAMRSLVDHIHQRRCMLCANADLRESRELFRSAFDESPIGIALVAPDGKFLSTNRTFTAITGFSEAELQATNYQTITHPDDLNSEVSLAEALLSGERQHYTIEKRCIRKDGSTIWVLLNVGLVFDDDRKPRYFVSQIEDITGRRESDRALRAYNRELEAAKNQLEQTARELVQQLKTTSTNIKLEGRRILLAEDGEDNQRLLQFYFRGTGACVEVASNGRIAVDEILRAQAAGQPYDMVLMDMQMPELDGRNATAELRRLGFTMPILAVTAHGMAGDREISLAAGCNDHLVKPICRDTLFNAISRWLKPVTEEWGNIRVLHSDLSADPDFAELVGTYVNELPGQVTQLQACLEHNQIDALRRLLHQIRGAGGGYGFNPISESAAAAETSILQAGTLDSVAGKVDELVRLIRAVDGYQASLEGFDVATRLGN